MYAVIRKLSAMRSVPEAARRAEIGIGQILKRSPGLSGDGSRGWAEHAPYDKVLVAAGAKEVPTALIAQLKPGGRLVMPLGPAEDQRLSVIKKEADDNLKARGIMPVRFSELET